MICPDDWCQLWTCSSWKTYNSFCFHFVVHSVCVSDENQPIRSAAKISCQDQPPRSPAKITSQDHQPRSPAAEKGDSKSAARVRISRENDENQPPRSLSSFVCGGRLYCGRTIILAGFNTKKLGASYPELGTKTTDLGNDTSSPWVMWLSNGGLTVASEEFHEACRQFEASFQVFHNKHKNKIDQNSDIITRMPEVLHQKFSNWPIKFCNSLQRWEHSFE